MCGLNAIFAYRPGAPRIDRDALIRVRDHMTARGPDGDGAWVSDDGRVGLGHRRLAIIDLSDRAAQPMASADGKLRITYNGEIYNYRALREELERDGCDFVSDSDTETLLHLYRRHGERMVEKLRGMFAFALWDETRGGMLLARDGFGIKPLYYADDGATLRAASQVKALLAGGGIDTAPEPAGHAGFYLLGYVPEPFTLYRGVRALPAGTTLWIDGNAPATEKRFFNLPDTLARAEAEAADTPDPEGELRALLVDSVAHHFVADVPVGMFLSAGIDSASLTGLAAELHGTDLRTVTLGFAEFAGEPRDEAPLAEHIASHYRTRHATRPVSRTDFDAERARVLAAMDQPSIDGVNTYFVSKVTAETGLKVAISGLGGDEMFAGYPSFRQVPLLARRLAVCRHMRGLGRAVRHLTLPALRRTTSPKYAGLIEYAGRYPGAYLLRRGVFMPWELDGVMEAELAREGLDALTIEDRLEDTVRNIRSPRLKLTALESCWYMRNQLLRDSDWAGMAHSLEIRVPLVDTFLFAGLAPLLAGPCPPGKRMLGMTPRPPLPVEVLDRPKTGFNVPVVEWLRTGMDAGVALDRDPPWLTRGFRGWARLVMAAQAGPA